VTADLVERLRAALDEAEIDIKDMGHKWFGDDRIEGAAGLRLVERDRALLARYEAVIDIELAWAQVEILHGEVERAAEFWLGDNR
jgi:hypothetical protein